MGIFLSCCGGDSVDLSETSTLQPDQETKRRQQAEAAEKRLRDAENRGIKNPSRLHEKQARLEEMERAETEAIKRGDAAPVLKWSVS